MDLLEDAAPTPNAPEFTVSELTGAVKTTLEGAFGRVRVRGEVGRVMHARSGHLYYDIKDDRNVIACTTWKGQIRGLGTEPEEGLEVIVTGRLSTFGPQSKYNLNVDSIEVAGAGALMAMLEKRRAKLAAEGLFDAARKRSLPYLPEVIGVVTSPQGAVIRDILHRLRERFPRKVLIWPVAVQGANCAPEVTRAIDGFNRLTPGGSLPRPDLLIVARGGGSLEDLWGFNEESVARAAAASEIPLISAVGHETDTTLIDHASDRRAPTPTAAAEMAVPVRMELLAWAEGQGARLSGAVSRAMDQRGQRLRDLSRALPRASTLLGTAQQQLDMWGERLPGALRARLARAQVRLAASTLRPGLLEGLIRGGNQRLAQLDERRAPALRRRIAAVQSAAVALSARLRPASLSRDLAAQRTALGDLARRLDVTVGAQIADRHVRLEALDRLRETLGYRQTLERGYAVVRDGETIVTTAAAAKAATALEIEFADGRMTPGPSKPRKAGKSGTPPPEQGSLF